MAIIPSTSKMHSFLLLLCTFATLVVFSFSASAHDLSEPTCDFDESSSASLLLLPSESESDPGLQSYSRTTLKLKLIATKFTYLIDFQVGGKDRRAVPDTGSPVVWVRGCKKESDCIDLLKTDDVCSQPECMIAEIISHLGVGACNIEKTCPFKATYLDGSSSKGVFGRGSFSFPLGSGSTSSGTKSYELWFGSSSETSGNIDEQSDGVVGLGPGKISFISQLRIRSTKPIFSYCLPYPNPNSESELIIGDQVPIPDSKYTIKLITPSEHACDYRAKLQSLSVGQDQKQHNPEYPMISIDSGATFTSLENRLFHGLKNYVETTLGTSESRSLCDRGNNKYDYHHCFMLQNNAGVLQNMKASFHFTSDTGNDHLELVLKHHNFLDIVSFGNEDYACLTVKHDQEHERNKLGSRAQIDFKVTFNRSRSSPSKGIYVSFEPHNCNNNKEKEKLQCDEKPPV